MPYYITFKQKGQLLVKYKVDSAASDDEVTAIPHQALDEFRKEFPSISLRWGDGRLRKIDADRTARRNGSRRRTMSKLYPSISGLSILMALALALGEWYFFFYGGTWEGPFGFFAPSRLGFNLAWLTLVYLSFQLLSIPLATGTRQRFIGVVDGMASLIPLGIALVVIFGKPELLGTPERWEAAFVLLFIAAIDLFGGYTFNIALSRRTMDVAGPTTS
jgi:hypothetical protein